MCSIYAFHAQARTKLSEKGRKKTGRENDKEITQR
jgi:hypothetical protein